MKKDNRINYIDITRGLAILFIVFGHTIRWSEHLKPVYTFLLSFHVVLFFIISGFLFNPDKYNFKDFIKKKFKQIVIPYVFWSLVFLIPYLLFGQEVNSTLETKASFDLKEQLINICYGIGKDGALRQNSSLWFLPALFTIETVYYIIIKYLYNNSKYKKTLIVALILIGIIFTNYVNISLPFGINTLISIGFFFIIGYCIRKKEIVKKLNYKHIIVTFLIGIMACYFNNGEVSCMNYKYGNYILALLSGLCLSLTVIYLASIIKKNKVIEYIGRNTMSILILHKLPILFFQTKLGIVTKMLKDSNFIFEIIICTVVLTISVALCLVGNIVLKKIAPFLIGSTSETNIWRKIVEYIKSPKKIIYNMQSKGVFNFLSDEKYIKLTYFLKFGKRLDLNNPVTFNEKLQWLKINDRNDLYSVMVDKYEVKDYVSKIIGEEYIIPTIGIYDNFEDINFENLPKQFVIKCTHDSGGLAVVKDKDKMDYVSIKNKINKSFKNNYYFYGREWPYKNVKPRIIIEKYMEDKETSELRDYKFFCFSGKVKFFKIDFNRATYHQANYYDGKGKLQLFGEQVCPPDYEKELKMPVNLSKMIKLSEKISKNNKFMRVDFYEMNGKVYFGEITFFPASGFGKFTTDGIDEKIGQYIDLESNLEE